MIYKILLILCMAPATSLAATSGKSYVGGGISFYNFYNTTATSDASTSLIGSYYLPIQYTNIFRTFESPTSIRLSYTPLPRTTGDGAASSTLLQFSVNRFSNFQSGTGDFSYGLGYIINTLSGKDGAVILNNGTGTSTYFRPDRSVSTRTLVIETGLNFDAESARFSAELFFSQLFSERRSYTLKLTYNYKLGGGF